ncbi:MAG: hypothetical protein R3B45_14190 [Bdellovibrionota bacterium]
MIKKKIWLYIGSLICLGAFYLNMKPLKKYQSAYIFYLSKDLENYKAFTDSKYKDEFWKTIDKYINDSEKIRTMYVGSSRYIFFLEDKITDLQNAKNDFIEFSQKTINELIIDFNEEVKHVMELKKQFHEVMSLPLESDLNAPTGKIKSKEDWITELLIQFFYDKYKAYIEADIVSENIDYIVLDERKFWHQFNPNYLVSIIVPPITLLIIWLLIYLFDLSKFLSGSSSEK